MDIKEYRQAILEAVLAAKDENGEPKIDELEAREMLEFVGRYGIQHTTGCGGYHIRRVLEFRMTFVELTLY